MKPQEITIRIGGREYRIDVNSPKEEELKRKAAVEINKRLEMRLKMKIEGVDDVDFLSLIALELGEKFFSEKEKVEALDKESIKLHKDIASYLENIDK